MTEDKKTPLDAKTITEIDGNTLADRFYRLVDYFKEIWEQETGQASSIKTHYAYGLNFLTEGQHFSFNRTYKHNGLSLELGANLGPMFPQLSSYFDQTPSLPWQTLNPKTEVASFKALQQLQPLSGVKVLCVGGIEGRLAALFGAEVINVDPVANDVPSQLIKPDKSIKITEITEPFTRNTFKSFQSLGPFDLVMSQWLFDEGSSFVTSEIGEPLSNYIELMFLMGELTRTGGYMLHLGDMVQFATTILPNFSKYCFLDGDKKSGNMKFGNWVMQKQANLG